MAGGTPVGRSWVVVLQDGTIVIDWGDGLFQEVFSGDFCSLAESQISHSVQDSDLNWLIQIGRVEGYDTHQVYFASLPEQIKGTIQ